MNHTQSNQLQQARALAWEFWVHGWRGHLLGLAGVVGFASLIYGVFTGFSRTSDLAFNGTEVGTLLHFGFFWVAIFFLGASILAAWGPPQRRYTLPTSSLVIVGCSMICSMVSMFALYALAATVLNLLYDAGWPIWVPGLVAAIAIAWLQAVLWSTSNSLGLQFVSSLASFGVVLYGAAKFAPSGEPIMNWFHEGADTFQVFIFGLATLVCVGVGTVGFSNLRHGSGFDVQRIVDWASRLYPKKARSTPFVSPNSAQRWLEWTQRGYVLPVGTALIGVTMLFITPFVFRADSLDFVGGISGFLVMPGLIVALYLGSRSDNGAFGNFGGSRPLTDSQIAKGVLVNATLGLLWSALIWALFVVAMLLILRVFNGLAIPLSEFQQNDALQLLSFTVQLLGITTLGVGAIWGVFTLIASIVLAGRDVGRVVACTVFGGWIAGGLGSEFLLTGEAQDTFRYMFVAACLLLPLMAFVATFLASWKLRLISHNTLWLAGAIVAVMFAAAYCAGFVTDREHLLLVLWGCCLTPFALGAAPLAVWWNRHR